jgi:ubiquinol-cytochrome c reductase cytochrome c subunit
MKFLSKYRRHKFATPLLLVIALSTLGFTFSAATASPAKSELSASAKSTLIAEGKEIFLKGCSSCHGLNGEGASIAPSLIGVGAASVDFQVGTGRMPMADMSQQAVRKAPLYTEEETAALAAYVATLAPGPASITNEEITWERDGSTADGGELFRNNCAMCHNFAGQGGALTKGKYAPTVMGVEPKHIYEWTREDIDKQIQDNKNISLENTYIANARINDIRKSPYYNIYKQLKGKVHPVFIRAALAPLISTGRDIFLKIRKEY